MIQETKCDKETMVKISKKVWKGCEIEVVAVEGASGGLGYHVGSYKMENGSSLQLSRIITLQF
jgi:hypothetical protein